MKTKFAYVVICLFAMTLLSGCVSTIVRQSIVPTIGQQLIDLKKARDAGVISQQEYDAEKTKLLNQKLPPQQ